MAITPKVLIQNPAAIAVAAMTVFGLAVTFNGLSTCPSAERALPLETNCESTAHRLGADVSQWSEMGWVVYSECFGGGNDFSSALGVASDGLRFYPNSEALTNLKGLNEIRLGDYDTAQYTLDNGLRTIAPTTGTMENNLAWAILWTNSRGEQFGLNRARTLYQRAVAKDASCELIHTGLMVEYSLAQESDVLNQAEALKNFQLLRRLYRPCESRAKSGEWEDLVELGGAFVLYKEVDQMLGVTYNMKTSRNLQNIVLELKQDSAKVNYSGVCEEAMPTRVALRRACEQTLNEQDQRMQAGKIDVRRQW